MKKYTLVMASLMMLSLLGCQQAQPVPINNNETPSENLSTTEALQQKEETPNISNAQAVAKDMERQAKLNNIAVALEVYSVDGNALPANTVNGKAECITDIPAAEALARYFPNGIPTDKDPNAKIGNCVGGFLYCRLDGKTGNYLLASYAVTEERANADADILKNLTVCNGGNEQLTGLFDRANGAIAIIK